MSYFYCRLYIEKLSEMANSSTEHESVMGDNSSSLEERSGKTVENDTIICNTSKRKPHESESTPSSTFKKARFAWQVKGRKEESDSSATDDLVICNSTKGSSKTDDLVTCNSTKGSSKTDSEIEKSYVNIPQPVLGGLQCKTEDRQLSNTCTSNQCHKVSHLSNVSNENSDIRHDPEVCCAQGGQPCDDSNHNSDMRQPYDNNVPLQLGQQSSIVTNPNTEVRQPPYLSNQQLFHAMDFDPPSSLLTNSNDHQRDKSSSFSITSEHLDILSNYLGGSSRVNPSSLSNPPRIKHYSTSLHACMVNVIRPVIIPITTADPNLSRSSAAVNTPNNTANTVASITPNNTANTVASINPYNTANTVANMTPNNTANTVASMTPNNTANTSTNNVVRERVEFSDALRRMHSPNLSEYEKWEKRNTAGAIVDNVFNRTLEEMGISPDAASNRRSMDRSAVENQSILAAISSQGLTPYRNERTEITSENEETEVQNDFEYLRQNRIVFNRMFERLGYRRYDIIQQHIPSNQTRSVNAQNPIQTENLATQTSDSVSSQHEEISHSIAHDDMSSHSDLSHSVTDISGLGRYRAELNVNIENIPTTSAALGSDMTLGNSPENKQVDTDNTNNDNNVSTDNDTKEKDTGVSENVLNLALSAAIQSQGLTLK